ncbi:MAG: HAD-IB family hydrolase [Acidimicrobiia bacterium]|nr:HAD-IB family hydrolase [Acidimicrobiia bacterium]
MTATRAAAFFDLDKTIIAKSSVLAFGRPLYRGGLLSKGAIIRSAYGQVVFMLVGADEAKMEKLRVAMLQMIKGWNQFEVAEIVRETLDEVVTPIIFGEALELIEEHQRAGRAVVIVSSAPEEVVRPLGEYLGADDVIATRPEVDRWGNYTGELAFYGYGPHKAEAIRAMASREGFDLDECFAYTDSVTDEPMLRAVGHPVAVNPDRDLTRLARDEDWPIMRFERPVRLRDRLPDHSGAFVVAGAAVIAAGTGAWIWWRLRRRDAA